MVKSGRLVSRILAAAVLVASVVAAGCASPAYSSESSGGGESDFARPGAYVGAYGIKSYEQFDTHDSTVTFGDSDLGIGLRIGYRLNEDIALEVIGEDVKGFSVSGSSADANLDLMMFGVNGKFFLASGRLQPYLLAGVGVARADVRGFNYDNDGGYFRAGLGMDIYVTSNFGFFGEANYNRMIGGVSDLHHIDLQLGIQFRF